MRIFFGGIFTGGNCLVGIIWVVIFQLGVFMSPRFYAHFMNSKDLENANRITYEIKTPHK